MTAAEIPLDELKMLEKGEDRCHLVCPVWTSEAFGITVKSACFDESGSQGLEGGASSGSLRRLHVVTPEWTKTFVVKRSSGDNPNQLELAREALFYQQLAPQLRDVVPACLYARGDMATGKKIIVMEDLSAGTVSGKLLGPAHPHNWAHKEQVEALTAAGPGIEAVIESTFSVTARVHAKFWRSEALQELSWLALRKEDSQAN
jgi:hypothetical protein